MTRDTKNKRQPSAAAKRKVADAFNAEVLADICTRQDFRPYAKYVELEPGWDGQDRFYYYQDNGSDILAVAHLDHVQDDGTCSVMQTASGLLAASGALDDRLGAYVILELLPTLGIECDVLLTTDEEIGQSTAEHFDTDKQYNWIIQFDRAGTDVVMYDYETTELAKMVEQSGARVGQGSFSDICMLEHLGCKAFNWGVGYQDYHSARSHAWLDDTFRSVARFVKFYNANKRTWLDHKPLPVGKWWTDYDKDGTTTLDAFSWEDDVNYQVTADCGHTVDLADDSTFVEVFAQTVLCVACSEDDLT